jgi:hypothetical protein
MSLIITLFTAHPVVFNSITLVANGEKHGLWNQKFHIAWLLDPGISNLGSTLFLKFLSPCTFPRVKDELPTHPPKSAGKITVLCIVFLYVRWKANRLWFLGWELLSQNSLVLTYPWMWPLLGAIVYSYSKLLYLGKINIYKYYQQLILLNMSARNTNISLHLVF